MNILKMTKNSQSIAKLLQALGGGNATIEQMPILAYVRSDAIQKKISQGIDQAHYAELCKLLIALVSKPVKEKITKNTLKQNMEAKVTLSRVLSNIGNYHINFFEMVLNIDRKERWKVLEVLDCIDIDGHMRIVQDSKLIDFIEDSLQMIESSVMEWINANTCIDNIESLIAAQSRTLTDEHMNEEHLIIKTLTLLYRLYEYISYQSVNINIESIHLMVFKRVVPLAYMGHNRQRKPALTVLNAAVKTNFIPHIKNKHPNLWMEYKMTLQNVYCTRMSLLVKAADHDWSNQWCLSIKILGTDLHRGAELINNLLNVEEKAFKSADMVVRKDAFESWKHLIDNFALDPLEFATSRRIKLLCIPLNAKNSKIESVAATKLETWWHLIVKLFPSVDELFMQVVGQFLNFCFGPLGDTPLLSRKCDVAASPGKRFTSTKIMSIDALFQLIVQNPNNRTKTPCYLKDRIPHAISSIVFESIQKTIFHCVGEAILAICECDAKVLNDRELLVNIIWLNLISYIRQSSIKQKAHLYKELVFIANEVSNYITDVSWLMGPFFTVVVNELGKVNQHLMYRDNTLMDLLLKFITPEVIKYSDKKSIKDLSQLIFHAVRPENVKDFHCNTLGFIKSIIIKMETVVGSEMINCSIFELWQTLSEIMIKYMGESQQMNEGTPTNHNFQTIESLILFPLKHIFWTNSIISKISKIWQELYRRFNIEADLITTVRPNEILDNISTNIHNCLLINRKCYSMIAHFLETLVSTINYQSLLSKEETSPLLILLQETAVTALTEKDAQSIEYSLKATSSLLIIVFGLNQIYTIKCLGLLKPVIERMLEIELVPGFEKEICDTWKIVVIIFRNLAKTLTHQFILSYENIISSAVQHSNDEISAQAVLLIDIKNELNEESKALFEQFRRIVPKVSRKHVDPAQEKNPDSMKHIQATGSFFNRKMSSSRTEMIIKKENNKKIKIQPIPPLPEPDSQDYVVIENDVKLDVNRLTEHQKESLKRYRDDIPAMYNDLSQSASRNSQQFETWVEKSSVSTRKENTHENDSGNISNNESNKENNASSCVDTIESINNERLNNLKPKAKSIEEKPCSTESTKQADKDCHLKKSIDIQTNSLTNKKTSSAEHQADIEPKDSPIPRTPAKQLSFKSYEEFLNEDSNGNLVKSSMESEKIKLDEEKHQVSNDITSKLEDIESQSLELSHSSRQGRSRRRLSRTVQKSKFTGFPTDSEKRIEQNLKRKFISDSYSDENIMNKRRRHSTTIKLLSDSPSGTERGDAIEEENFSMTLPNDNLPKRTKKEMSRLQINMVFNNKMPSKLRSKSADDFIYENHIKTSRHKAVKNVDKSSSQSGYSQEPLKKRTRRDTRRLAGIEIELTNSIPIESIQTDVTNSKTGMTNDVMNDEKKLNETSELTSIIESDENLNPKENEEFNDNSYDSTKIFVKDKTNKNSLQVSNNENVEHIDEIVECSQKNTSPRRSPLRKNQEERLSELIKMSPKKVIVQETPDDSFLDESLNEQQVKSSQESIQEEAMKAAELGFHFTSPKGINQPFKSKTLLTCRAAHMLGMVTKLAIGEKNESDDKIKCIEDDTNRKVKLREWDGEGSAKKERSSILKESDRIGSPSGSRQEKIFNNMKSKDYAPLSPSKLFSNLKNDGEKVSSTFEKTIFKKSMKGNDKDQSVDSNTCLERDELPLLEWSNANPPSLTASPSSSILKRQRQMTSEIDNDTTLNKRKRVSFADPPVSREMGYKILGGTSLTTKNKTGQSRNLLGRKDTLIKMKESRFKAIRMNIEKFVQVLDEELNESVQESKSDSEIIESLPNTLGDIERELQDCDVTIRIPSLHENKLNNMYDESINTENTKIESTRLTDDNVVTTKSVNSIDKNNIEEIRCDSSKIKKEIQLTPLDIVNSHELKPSNKLDLNGSNELHKRETNDSNNLEEFNITDDPTIANILNASDINDKTEVLEDTVDIQNVSNLNSSVSSDETFCTNLPKMSTSIAAETIFVHCDALPISDSMSLSQVSSQDSLATQGLALTQPHTMDTTLSICPELSDCNDSIDRIVNDLVDPLWVKNLLKYFTTRNIKTIGDLAQLSEREVSRFPVKGSPKVDYIKEVLTNFSLSHLSMLKDEVKKDAVVNEAMYSTLRLSEKHEKITDYKNNENDSNADLNATSLSPLKQYLADDHFSTLKDEIKEKPMEPKIIITEDNSSIVFGSQNSLIHSYSTEMNQPEKIVIPSPAISESLLNNDSMDPLMLTPSIKSENDEKEVEEYLDKVDPMLLLQSAIKRNKSENIIKQFMIKIEKETQQKKNTTPIQTDESFEAAMENTCCQYGLTKISERLPNIFSSHNQSHEKVVSTYRLGTKIDDCTSTLDFDKVKQAICKKSSATELCEMLSIVLKNEKKHGIKTPVTEVSTLNEILKRMPMDSIISNTIANEELIPSSIVLEVALQNNSPDIIVQAINARFSNVVEHVMNLNMSADKIISHINKAQLSNDNLLDIYRTLCDKINPPQLLDAFNEAMRKKFNSLDFNRTN